MGGASLVLPPEGCFLQLALPSPHSRAPHRALRPPPPKRGFGPYHKGPGKRGARCERRLCGGVSGRRLRETPPLQSTAAAAPGPWRGAEERPKRHVPAGVSGRGPWERGEAGAGVGGESAEWLRDPPASGARIPAPGCVERSGASRAGRGRAGGGGGGARGVVRSLARSRVVHTASPGAESSPSAGVHGGAAGLPLWRLQVVRGASARRGTGRRRRSMQRR